MAFLLPIEIYEHILIFITDVKDLKNVALTSRVFYDIVTFQLWSSPALKYDISHSEFASLQHLPIKELRLTQPAKGVQNKNLITNKWLHTIVSNWKNLTALYLTNCSFITNGGIKLLANLTCLQCLYLPSYKCGFYVTHESVSALVDLPLRELSISGGLVNTEVAVLIGQMTKLAKLFLIETAIGGEEMRYLDTLNELKTLHISSHESEFVQSLSEKGLSYITDLPLEELKLSNLDRFDDDGDDIPYTSFMEVISRFKSLKKLELMERMVSNECLTFIGKLCLSSLEFSVNPEVTFSREGIEKSFLNKKHL